MHNLDSSSPNRQAVFKAEWAKRRPQLDERIREELKRRELPDPGPWEGDVRKQMHATVRDRYLRAADGEPVDLDALFEQAVVAGVDNICRQMSKAPHESSVMREVLPNLIDIFPNDTSTVATALEQLLIDLRRGTFAHHTTDQTRTFLLRRIRWRLADKHRAKRDEASLTTDDGDQLQPPDTREPTPDEATAEKELMARLAALADALPDRERAAVLVHLAAPGIDPTELAGRLGCSPRAAVAARSRGLDKLRARLGLSLDTP